MSAEREQGPGGRVGTTRRAAHKKKNINIVNACACRSRLERRRSRGQLELKRQGQLQARKDDRSAETRSCTCPLVQSPIRPRPLR